MILLNAQSDGFFANYYEHRDNNGDEWGRLILLPDVHGSDYNYNINDVNLGTGVLLMTIMCMGYSWRRKRSR